MKIKVLVVLVCFLAVASQSAEDRGRGPANNAWVKVLSRIGFGTLGFSGREAAEAFDQMTMKAVCHLDGEVKILFKEGQNMSCVRISEPMNGVQTHCGMTLDLQAGAVTGSRWYTEQVGLELLPNEAVDEKLCE